MTDEEVLARRFEDEAAGLDQELAVAVAASLWRAAPSAARRETRDRRLREAAAGLGGSVEWKAERLARLLQRALAGQPLPRVPEAIGVAAAVAVLPRRLSPRQVRRILTSRPRNVRASGGLLGERRHTP